MKRRLIRPIQTDGQVLVTFVLILPFLCLGLFAFINYGRIEGERRQLKNIATLLCPSVLEEKEEQKIEELAYRNDRDISSIDIKKKNKEGTIVLEKEIRTLFFGKKKTLSVKVHCVS